MNTKDAVGNLDVLDLVQESVVVFGVDGCIKSWNAAAERLYGWHRSEVLGRNLKATVQCSPPKPDGFLEYDLPLSNRWEGELTRLTKSGQRVIVKSTWSLRRDANGDPTDIVDTSVDVTAERRMQEELRRVEYRYYNLFQATAASFWELDFSSVGKMVQELTYSGVTDLGEFFKSHLCFVREMIAATRVLDVNNQSVEMFGRGSKEELLGDLSRFWPDESVAAFGESVAAAMSGKSHYAKETRLQALDGRQYDTLFTACFPPEMLSRGKVLAGIIDISDAKQAKTALEQSERRYRNLFHFMPIALWQLDGSRLIETFRELRRYGVTELSDYIDTHPELVQQLMDDLIVLEVNQRTVELVGARDASELRGKPVTRFWTESPDVFRRSVEASFRGETYYESQIRCRTLDDRVVDSFFVAAFSAHIQEASISLIGMIDISDRIRAQEMLAQVQADFAHAARVSMLGELTASIAHEVNQPLTAVVTNGAAALRWLDRSNPDIDEVRELTRNSVADAQRAAEIIRRVRSMAVHAAPEKALISIRNLIDESLKFLDHEMQRQGVHVALNLPRDLPNLVVDRIQVQQVIVNIAVNAMQSMADSQVRRFTVSASVLGGNTLEVRMEDTGLGIPPDFIDRLFESFFTTKRNGMGIGLPICRSIMESHGGRITAANREKGPGAVFSLFFPLAP